MVEVDREGEEVWAFEAKAQPTGTLRRKDGTTLIASERGVVAVDPSGETVWLVDLGGYVVSIARR